MSNTRTLKLELSEVSKMLPERIVKARTISDEEWIAQHASGTLKDNKEQGFSWKIQCLSERVAYTFGYGFSAYKHENLVYGPAITECDDPAYTVCGRLFKAYNAKKLFPEDYFEVKYVREMDGNNQVVWEGLGVIVRETSATFIPDGKLVMAKVVQFDTAQKKWLTPVNFA